MLSKLIAFLVVVTAAFNATIVIKLRRRARGHLRIVYFFLALSSLILVAQSVVWSTRIPIDSVFHRNLVELSVLLWAASSTIGIGYSLVHRPGPSPLTRTLDVIVACLGVLVLLWTTAIVPTLSTTTHSTVHTAGLIVLYTSISACTGLSLALSRISSTRGRPELIANIISSLLIALAQTFLLLRLHQVWEIPLTVIHSMTWGGLAVFNITHSTRFERFTLRFPTRRIKEVTGVVLYLPLLAFPIVAVVIDRQSFALTTRNLLLSLLVVVLIARIRLFEELSHRRREALEKRISQRTSELAVAHDLVLQIMDVAEDGMIAVDGGKRPLLLNRSARTILQLTGSSTTDGLPGDPVRIDENPILEIFDAARESQELGRRVQREVTIAGRSRHLEILVRRISDSSERLVAVFRDVTDDISLLQKKSRFVSMVSHEIRTPLTSLSGSLALVRSGALGEVPPEAQRMIDIASSSTERLVRLVNDVLVFNRLDERGPDPINFARIDTCSIVREAADSMQPLANSQCQTIEVVGCEGQIEVDPDRLHQVLINLIQNALKFSPSLTRVLLRTRLVDDEVEFEVADEGRGIPVGSIESVFEPFFQVDESDSRIYSGTGLGLAICRGIVERHGGRIWAENRQPRGVSVKFRLPSAPASTNSLFEKVAS